MLRKLFRLLLKPSSRYSLGAILLAGVVGGILFWGSFNWAMDASNSEAFCTSCHEMSWALDEYKTTHHYSNRSGVRASCPDCHVPKSWVAKTARKIQASLTEVPATIMGTINTSEKYEAHRLRLANKVWASMKKNDSRECRNCHSQESMKLADQDKSARKKHSAERWREKGETCIDCHKGIAHEMPEDFEDS